MKKLLTLFIFIIILFLFSFLFVFVFFNLLPPENTVNVSLRKYFLKNIYVREILRLQKVGDAKYDFKTSDNFKNLNIEIIDIGNESLSEITKNSLSEKINSIINKPEGITVNEKKDINSFKEEIDDKDIKEIISKYPVTANNGSDLIIFVVKKYQKSPTYAGLVYDSNHIFIFMDPIRDISYYEKGTEKAEISTILHEFAHLLGAGHVLDENCILSEKVENTASGKPQELVTNYCQKDLEEISRVTSF